MRETTLVVNDPEAISQRKHHEENLWVERDIPNLLNDKQDFSSLEENVREILMRIFVFFTLADQIVGDIASDISSSDFTEFSEQKDFYSFQISMEALHKRIYSNIIIALVPEGVCPCDFVIEKMSTFRSVLEKK